MFENFEPLKKVDDINLTTIHFKNILIPSDIMNKLINYFNNDINSSIIKINYNNYNIKVEIFYEFKMSLIKFILYNNSNNNYLLELHRYKGCILIFNIIYNNIILFFKNNFNILNESTLLKNINITQINTYYDIFNLKPLIDLLKINDLSDIQIESLCILANIINNKDIAIYLCNEDFIKNIIDINKNNINEIEFPISYILLKLSYLDESIDIFEKNNIIIDIKKKINIVSLIVKNNYLKIIESYENLINI